MMTEQHKTTERRDWEIEKAKESIASLADAADASREGTR